MVNNMQDAVAFFSDMGLPIKNGLIDVEALTEEQIKILEQWEQSTEIEGIMMPGIGAFYKSVLVAISTNPQRDADGKIRYLFGKGIGVEIALRGEIPGRTKFNTNPMYRSHSDFELYDAKGEPYSPVFKRIFGGQEYYPSTDTKGLHGIPEGQMDETCETVNLDGYEVLIPQLELLFIDKFLKKEATPRGGVYDYEVLAREYGLDVELVKQLFQKFYFSGYEERQVEEGEAYKKRFTKMLAKNLNRIFDENNNKKETMNRWNECMSSMSGDSYAIINGINSEMYIPLEESDTYIGEDGEMVITKDYVLRTIDKITEVTQRNITTRQTRATGEIDGLFHQIEEDRAITRDDGRLGVEDFRE